MVLEESQTQDFLDGMAHLQMGHLQKGLDISLYPYTVGRHDCLHLAQIWAKKDAKAGTGTAFMEELCEFADKYQLTITLDLGDRGADPGPEWKKTTSRARLRRFYRRFQFQRNATRGRYELRGAYHRTPK